MATQVSLLSGAVASAGSLLLQTNGTTTQATIDTSGNLGLGVTPSSWGSGFKAMDVNTYGAVSSSTTAFRLFANSYGDGTNWIYKTTAAASRYDQTGGSHAWQIAASGTAGNPITFTQAMTLDASGNLGVGTTSPAANYRVDAYQASNDTYIRARTGGSTAGFISENASNKYFAGVYYSTSGAYQIHDITNGATRMTIDSSGNLLVGQTTRSGTTVGFSVSPTGSVFTALSASTNSTTTWDTYSTGAGAYRFYIGMAGTVYATNTTITSLSDVRHKENIRDLDDGLEKIMALQPRKFDWKEGKGANIKNARGFIAQEFEQVFPDMIEEWRDPAPEGEEPYKAVNANLIPTLVKAIQEQQTIITALTARIEALEQA